MDELEFQLLQVLGDMEIPEDLEMSDEDLVLLHLSVEEY